MSETKALNKQLNTSITEYMAQEAVQKNIANALGNRKMQFITSVASLVNSSESLKECDVKSVLSACLVAASLDLPLNQNLGFAYVIPYNNKTKRVVIDEKTGKEKDEWYTEKIAQFQMGYKGFVQLAQRSGLFKTINATDVREGEITGIDRLTGEIDFEWVDGPDREKLNVVGYVAYMKLTTGFEKSLYMTAEELEKHAKRYSSSYRSQSKGTNVWRDDFDAMAKKTVIKLLLSKYAPMTPDMAKAYESDQAAVSDEEPIYIDNEPKDPKQLAREKEVERVKNHIENSKTVEELEQCRGALTEETKDLFTVKFDELAAKEAEKGTNGEA